MTIRELQELAYKQSADKGFHDNEPTEGRALLSLNAERIALMHSELSEALEELRNGHAPATTYYPHHKPGCAVSDWKLYNTGPEDPQPNCTCTPKPEGVPSEMADVVIRVLDFCGANGIDLEAIITEKLAYNATRGRMHGGKEF
jgi:NTP pyrophosphatase (non-canonical NTP hydrolase)